jgi:uncharacterized repeat protein (TIGR03803 family)
MPHRFIVSRVSKMQDRFTMNFLKSKIISMKTQFTTLHNESRTCVMTGPVGGTKPLFALPIRSSAFSLQPLAFPMKPVLALLMRLLWAAALVLPVFGAQASVVFTTLHLFQGFSNGTAELVQGSDGNFYGTTEVGGTEDYGTVFKISTNGALTSLYFFTGGNDGANPHAGLVQGTDGNFYGTTSGGGTNGSGTVFRIGSDGAFTSLYSFTGGNDGANPQAGLVQGSDGNFYGTTIWGGTNDYGTVFRINTNGVLTSLHSFNAIDGAYPSAGLVEGSDGNFYGTTPGGTTNHLGSVFKISTTGALTTLHLFTGGNDGGEPKAGLVQGSDGNFYGTTPVFYDNLGRGYGTVFKISPNGVLTNLYSFAFTGENPEAGLVQGSDGNFYGTTTGRGTKPTGHYGAVFQISTNGALISLYSFTGGNDGANPQAGLVQGSDGKFYGLTSGGGTSSDGTVFQISTNGALTSLHSFTAGDEGSDPQGALVQGSDGNFYGTTYGSGTYGSGTVFKISTKGAVTGLYSFTGGNDGANPNGLVQGSDGNFYGTTGGGGTNGGGTVFKISTNGSLTTLYSFTGGTDGRWPFSALVQGSDGYLYGTTLYDRTNNNGTVFKISTNGAFTSLYSFTGANDGANPNGLVQGSDGNLYGTTSDRGTYGSGAGGYGTVFQISTNGVFTTLHSFTGGNDGANPAGGLVQGSDGNFYGTAAGGGTHGNGTVFKMSSKGALTGLYSFTRGSGVWGPSAVLVQGNDGNLYGITWQGGTNGLAVGGYGTVFQISTNGSLTTLYSFTGGHDGAYPQGGLVQGSDGSFYGTTSSGTVFRLTIVPDPQLTLIPSGPYVILTWPTDYAGFSYAGYALQSTTNLGSSAVWSTVSPEPVVIGGENVVINTISGAQKFFRLSQ